MVETRSFLLSYAITSAVCTVVMGVTWIRNRRHVAGADLWSIGFVMLFFALLLTIARNNLPDLFGIMVPNVLVIAGALILLMGLERFVGKPGSHLHNYILLIIFIIVHAWFTYGQPSLSIRTINFLLAFIIILGQGMWLLLKGVEPDQRPTTRGVGLIILVFCLLAVGRLFSGLIFDLGEDFFQPGLYGVFYVLANQMVLIILTFGLVLMVNRRLTSNLERGLLQRRQVEEALQDSKSRHQSLFDNMMDGYAYCKMIFGPNGQPEDFIYLDVNRSFEELTGLTNVQGKRVTELIPEIRDLNPELFETYARVVLTGKSEKFETRINPLEMWFSVSVYKSEADHFTAIFENITEQKQMEAALKTNQKLAEELYESAPDAQITVDAQGQITRLNSRAVVMFGYTREELLNKPIETLIPKKLHIKHEQDSRKFIESPHVRAMGSGLELRAIKKNGQEIPVEIELSPLRIGEETFVTADIRDISERINIEDILRRRNETLATLNQTVLDLVNRLEMEDILQTLLAKAQALLDAPDVSVDLFEDDDTIVTYAATSGQPLAKGDRMRRGEGGWLSWQAVDAKQSMVLEDYATWPQRRHLFDTHPIHAIMIAPIIQRGEVVGTVNYSRTRENYPFSEMDINLGNQLAHIVALMLDNSQIYLQLRNELAERKQMQEVLRINQENFMGYFNMGAVGMSVTTPNRSWIEVNDQLCHMLGYSKEELKKLTWSELTHPDDLNADMELFNQAMRGERNTYQTDKRFIRRDGGILHASVFVSCQRFPDGSPRYFLASIVDISERVRNEKDLRATQEQLAEQRRTVAVIEERQRLARDLHDSVSQSLHSLNLFSETLTASLAKGNPERTLQLAERLQESARQALKEARLMLYQLQPSGLDAEADLVREIEARLSSVEGRAGVRASVKVEGDTGECPRAWRENLFRIVIEALNNSLKHAQAHNVTVSFRCSTATVELEIKDDGIGFDLARARTGGMGLRTMRERAELLGGTLDVRSLPGEGTSVTVRLEKKDMT